MNEFWTAFGAIGTTLGSLVTACAVVIAVRQYRLPMKKKIKISFSRSFITPPFEGIKNDFYVIHISNIGIRDIKINGIYFNVGKYDIFDFSDTMQIPISIYKISLPVILKPEESIDFSLQCGKVKDAIKIGVDQGKNTIRDKVKVHITDSSGGSYYKDTKQVVKYYI